MVHTYVDFPIPTCRKHFDASEADSFQLDPIIKLSKDCFDIYSKMFSKLSSENVFYVGKDFFVQYGVYEMKGKVLSSGS